MHGDDNGVAPLNPGRPACLLPLAFKGESPAFPPQTGADWLLTGAMSSTEPPEAPPTSLTPRD